MLQSSARRFFRTPKGLLLVVMLALATLAAIGEGPALVAPGMLAACGVAMLIDAPILRLREGEWLFPSGALLTGLFVAMILSPHEPLHVTAITSAIAIASKYAFRVGSANVFNPAALALVATFYMFDTAQSWWGALPDLPTAAIAALFLTGAFITDRVNKVPVVLAYLGTYFLLFTLTAFIGDPAKVAEMFRAPNLHAALFFAFFMVTDPPTSPPKRSDQLIYGVIVAVGSYVTFELTGAAYFLLAGLLVANVWEARRRNRLKVRPVNLPDGTPA